MSPRFVFRRKNVPCVAEVVNRSLKADCTYFTRKRFIMSAVKDVRVHAPITCIKLGIPIYLKDHSEFITVQCKKILSRANNNEIKCFEFRSIKRALRPRLHSYINFNISICFPLLENMTILSK